MVLKEQDLVPQLDEMLACSRPSPDRRPKSQPKQLMKCPRCDSLNTKFCYYNNYSLTQPRHFCKACRRYWTKGGILRNVPVGGGCRKNKRSKTKNAEQLRAPTASDSTLSTTDPAAMRGEDSCVTNVSAFSSCDGSPSAPTSQNVAGSCTTSGYFSLPRDDAGSVRSPFDGLDKVKHVLSLGEQAGISNSHTIFSRGETENFPSFLSSSNMSVDCLTLSDAGRMGFNFSSSPIFGRADTGLLSNGDMCQVYESLPSHFTGSNSTSDFENIGMLADRSNLGYYWALHQLHKLGVPFEEGHTTDGQSIREDPLTESCRHTKGKVNVAGHSFLEEISNGFPGSFDWQLPSEQLFETPGDLCCLPRGMWSDFSQLGPCSGPFT